jgi:hypothetical protein
MILVADQLSVVVWAANLLDTLLDSWAIKER